MLQHAAESLSRRTCCLRRLLQSCMRVMASAMTIVVTSCATLEGIQRMQVADLSRGHRLCSLQASHSFDCGSWSTKVLQGAAGGRDGHQRGSGYTLSKSSFITKKDHLLEDRWSLAVSPCTWTKRAYKHRDLPRLLSTDQYARLQSKAVKTQLPHQKLVGVSHTICKFLFTIWCRAGDRTSETAINV